MRRLTTAALAAGVIGLGGCSLQYDRHGNPVGAGFTVAASEEPTNIDRVADAAREVSWLIDPKLGLAVGGIAGAFGLGKRESDKRREAAEKAWDESEARTLGRMAPAPVANPAEVQA